MRAQIETLTSLTAEAVDDIGSDNKIRKVQNSLSGKDFYYWLIIEKEEKFYLCFNK